MNRVVPPLHESHASIYLQEAFEKALEAFDQWSLGRDEPFVRLDDKDVPISSIFGRMRTSDDIMPERMRMLAQSLLGRPLDTAPSRRRPENCAS